VGLKDVAGVFSKELVIGFFLPVFFVLVALAQLLTDALLPGFYVALKKDASRLLVLGGLAAFGGLLLSGLYYNVLRLFQGYPLDRRQDTPIVSKLYATLLRRQRARFHDLVAARKSTSKVPAHERARQRAKQALAEEFPARCDQLLPTAFGNAVRSFERHPRARWGLNGPVVWPRIELLLNEQQTDLQSSARTDVAFFVNFSLLASVAGVLFTIDWIWHTPLSRTLSWLLLAIPFVVAWLAYRAAVNSAVRWGEDVRAAFDMHRLEMYRRLGVQLPRTHAQEIVIARAVNRCLAYGDPLPGAVRHVEQVSSGTG
jgi:hypothetical protein